MKIRLEPGIVRTWPEFVASCAGPAVALDGYVDGPSRVDAGRAVASFDHHGGALRFATRSTVEQVFTALLAGLPFLTDRELDVYVNDVDPDVALSVYLIRFWDEIRHNPEHLAKVRRLVHMEGLLDASGGCVSDASDAELAELAYMLDPWAQLVFTPAEHRTTSVLDSVCDRVRAWVRGAVVGYVSLSDRYERLEAVGDVTIVTESHPMARLAMRRDGIGVFVSVRPGPTDTTSVFTIGHTSMYAGLDLRAAYESLNLLEIAAARPDLPDGQWGGADMLGGSPRGGGSRLDPVTVAATVSNSLGRC